MTKNQKFLIETLISFLPNEQKAIYGELAYFLVDLGYLPQKQQVSDYILSFKHKENKKVIAKMGIRKNVFFSVRFFACKTVSEKFLDALRKDIDSYKRQYTDKLSFVPNTESMVKNKCGYCGDICTGGGYGYYYKFSDYDIVKRCGAYPVVIPDITKNDIDEIKRIITEQHNFFVSV